jgi:hypothetical protein
MNKKMNKRKGIVSKSKRQQQQQQQQQQRQHQHQHHNSTKKGKKGHEEKKQSVHSTPINPIIIPQRKQKVPKRLSTSNSTKNNLSTDTHTRTVTLQCWAHTKKGKRCNNSVSSREGEPIPIPYCSIHLKSGDGSLKVVNHPFVGKCLVARYDLPKYYRMAFWGERGRCPPCDKEDRSISYYPPNKNTGLNKLANGTNKIDNYNGVLNPTNTGDIIQYAACPGPNERQNIKSTFHYWGTRNGNIGGLEFVTIENVPKNTQLCHWYGSGWWNSRELKRCDVGTRRYPAPKRKKEAK